jgi:hypothetical protein
MRAQQRTNPREVLGRESHREFQLVVALEYVRDFPAAAVVGE